MDKNKRINELIKELVGLVPTMMFIGKTEDNRGALLLASPEKDEEKRPEDIAKSIAMMLEQREDARSIVFSAVCYFMHMHPDYQTHMASALEIMKKREPHPAETGEVLE